MSLGLLMYKSYLWGFCARLGIQMSPPFAWFTFDCHIHVSMYVHIHAYLEHRYSPPPLSAGKVYTTLEAHLSFSMMGLDGGGHMYPGKPLYV